MTSAWDREYVSGGIPSSYREEPSGVLVWALANWHFLSDGGLPRRALDVGCGSGRNAAHMVCRGIRTVALDSSTEALARASARRCGALFLRHDLRQGLPARTGSVDLATDIFVYKHLTNAGTRAAYRAELARVLSKRGALLVSLALPQDGYYSSCPDLPGRERERPRVVIDPITGIASVLFSIEDLELEFGDFFRLEMVWRKRKPGPMHGGVYLRYTLAALWTARLR